MPGITDRGEEYAWLGNGDGLGISLSPKSNWHRVQLHRGWTLDCSLEDTADATKDSDSTAVTVKIDRAKVRVTTTLHRTDQPDESPRYKISNLRPGAYRVWAETRLADGTIQRGPVQAIELPSEAPTYRRTLTVPTQR